MTTSCATESLTDSENLNMDNSVFLRPLWPRATAINGGRSLTVTRAQADFSVWGLSRPAAGTSLPTPWAPTELGLPYVALRLLRVPKLGPH